MQDISPAISERHAETSEESRSPKGANGIKTQGPFTESIDHITKTLPSHHLDQGVGQKVGHVCVHIGGLDIGQWVRKRLSSSPRHPISIISNDPMLLLPSHLREYHV